MNRVIHNKIFQAIKLNDLVLFSASIKGNENLAFGRFPLLSLCYLYNATKIIKHYKTKLGKMIKYKVVDENFEIYKKFRSVAGRCLRLYSGENIIVSPLEMLAILHKDNKVKKHFNVFEKDEIIINNLTKIYSIYGQKVEIKTNGIIIEKLMLGAREKLSYKLIFCLSLVFVVLLSGLYTLVGYKRGLGTSFSPFEIYNQHQLLKALNSSGSYVLSNNIVVEELNTNLSFNGLLNGNNHTIYIKKFTGDSLIENNYGTVKNLKIEFERVEADITDSLSLFTQNNNGFLNNIEIKCESLKLNAQKSEDADIFVTSFVLINNGEIKNCSLNILVEINASGKGECFVSGFASKNYNKIENCEFKEGSSILTAEADVCGMVSINHRNAKIINCKNFANISQTSSENSWSPNVSGVVLTNYGTIKNTHNKGNLSVTSKNVSDSAEGSVFIGGIVTMNYGSVEKCLNKGNLTAFSKEIIVYAGGITAYSIYYTENQETYMPKIFNCGASGIINVATENVKSYVFAGGISGYLYGEIENCYSLSTFTNGYTKEKYFVGNTLGSAYLQYQVFNSVICIDASGNFIHKQDNAPHQIGCLINGGNIVVLGVDTSNGEILTMETKEQIQRQEIYFDE